MGSGKILKDSRKKYGDHSHLFDVLQRCSSRNELVELEKKTITSEMLRDERCMNLSYGGEGGSTGRSAETRLKISQSRMGKKQKAWSQESKMKLSHSKRGISRDAETRLKISTSKRGTKMSADVKQKISNTLKVNAEKIADRQRKVIQGRHFYNNGKIVILTYESDPRLMSGEWVKGKTCATQ